MNALTRREFLKASSAGMLVVGFSLYGSARASTNVQLAPAKSVEREALDAWLSIDREGRITIYSGKVDLGTGVKTALAQIAAEELYVPLQHITMVMGDTATTPDQWLTGGALSISQGGSELRIAAANAREALRKRAAEKLSVAVDELEIVEGVIRVTPITKSLVNRLPA